ncbi:MAG: hypothetical protein ACPGNV_18120 [Mangrovicoccus sp.]
MAIEAGGRIADLNALWPLASDEQHEGDDHIRLIKAALQASFALDIQTGDSYATLGELQICFGVASNSGDQTSNTYYARAFLSAPVVVATAIEPVGGNPREVSLVERYATYFRWRGYSATGTVLTPQICYIAIGQRAD